MNVKTNVVVISYNALDYTKATVNSLLEKTKNDFNLTIVDNGSNRDTIEYLETLRPCGSCKKVTIIKNNENTGVGHAYNQGQQVSFIDRVEFTAFCNNDLFFSYDWLSKLEQRLDENQNVAMLCPLRPSAKVKFDEKTSTRDKLADIEETDDWKRELEQYSSLNIDLFDHFANQVCGYNRNGDIEIISFPDSLSTCVCLTRNNVFEKLGYFADTSFTVYGGEDIDMSWTVMAMGYDCAIDHGVYVHHFRGKSLKSNNMERQELIKKSNKLLYSKWKYEIEDFVKQTAKSGVDILSQIQEGQKNNYWLLFELNKDENFLEKIKLYV